MATSRLIRPFTGRLPCMEVWFHSTASLRCWGHLESCDTPQHNIHVTLVGNVRKETTESQTLGWVREYCQQQRHGGGGGLQRVELCLLRGLEDHLKAVREAE
jgi:hypothetical protein